MAFLCTTARLLPLLICFFTLASIFLTYGVAVAKNHVSVLWPYISDTGTKPPESCIFGLLLSFIAFLMYIIIYIRYREVSEFAKLYPSVKIKPVWNRVAACLGCFSALGLHMVASFQEHNEFTTHIIGALICFFSATIYFFFQTIFTRKMQPEAKLLFWIRILFTLLNVLFIVGTFAPVGAALKEFKVLSLIYSFLQGLVPLVTCSKQVQATNNSLLWLTWFLFLITSRNDVLKWTKNDGGFHYHLISTFSEWFLVFSFCAYICTIFWDFRKIKIEPPQIKGFIKAVAGYGMEKYPQRYLNETLAKSYLLYWDVGCPRFSSLAPSIFLSCRLFLYLEEGRSEDWKATTSAHNKAFTSPMI